MRAILSFLTRLPLGHGDIKKASEQQYLFPLVGLLIGLIAYLVGYAAMHYLPLEIAVLITILSLYVVIGLLHLDGLADFSDGVMVSGDIERKVAVMKDPKVGTAGIFAIIIVLSFTFLCLRHIASMNTNKTIYGIAIPFYPLFSALILSEVSAKLSMNTCIFIGKETHGGIGSVFIKRTSPIRYVVAFSIAILICLLVAFSCFYVVLTGVFIGIIIVWISNKNFGGVNGDVIGASNEIARVVTLLVLIMVV